MSRSSEVLTKALLLLCLADAAQAMLRDGNYHAVSSNNDSVCPQRVKTVYQDGQLTALLVHYAGDCNDQGPYEYYCDEKPVCAWGNESFEIHTPSTYTWRNGAHGIWGEFELAPKK